MLFAIEVPLQNPSRGGIWWAQQLTRLGGGLVFLVP